MVTKTWSRNVTKLKEFWSLIFFVLQPCQDKLKSHLILSHLRHLEGKWRLLLVSSQLHTLQKLFFAMSNNRKSNIPSYHAMLFISFFIIYQAYMIIRTLLFTCVYSNYHPISDAQYIEYLIEIEVILELKTFALNF
jgi:hypothetical protein